MLEEDTRISPGRRTFCLGEECRARTVNVAFLAYFPFPLNICFCDILRVSIFGGGTPS